MESLDNQIVVSIQCLVYNHEPYLRQCLDGFVMQETNFPFEAIVHDDCSTDGSAAIIREYAEAYPDIIKPIYETENQYSKGDGSLDRIMREVISPSSKYIAICEGDDYWTDPYKLQKQVDYMEAHPECGLVHAYTNCYYQNKKVLSVAHLQGELDSSYNDILWANPITTLSVLYRKELADGYKSFIEGQAWSVGDLPHWLYISLRGGVHKQNFVCGVYRVVENSASHGSSYEKRINYINTIYDIVCFYAERCGCEDFNKLEQRHFIELFNEAFAFKRYKTAKEVFTKIKNPNWKLWVKRFMCL